MAFLDETGLEYYTTKIKDYISQKINSAVGNITSFRFEIVTELPQTGEVGVVYLKALAEQESSNLYEEFIWVDDSYEFLGTNEIDLSNYYTKEETNKLVEDSAYTLPTASATELGGIKVGDNLTIENGVLSVAGDFTGTASAYEAGQNISIQDGEISALGYTYDGVSTVDFENNIVKFGQGSSIKEVDRSLVVSGDSGLDLSSDGNIKIASEANLVETSSAGDIKTTTDSGSIYMTAGTNIELDAEVIKLSTAQVLSDVNVDGKVNASGGFFQTSDLNKKNVLSELDLNKAYELIDKCQTILYTLKGSDDVQIGLIAQEVQEIFPELVTVTADGSLALDYSRLTVVILRVLKDLIVRMQNLESK